MGTGKNYFICTQQTNLYHRYAFETERVCEYKGEHACKWLNPCLLFMFLFGLIRFAGAGNSLFTL